ncbi:MAG: magnesium transporter [Myxococcota bacterium]
MAADLTTAYDTLARLALSLWGPDAFKTLEEASPEELAAYLATLEARARIQVMRRLTPDVAVDVLIRLTDDTAKEVLNALEPHRSASLLSRVDEPTLERCLDLLEPRLRTEITALMTYPPDSAGALMNPRVTAFRPDSLVSEVVSRLKILKRERIQDIFLVDEEGKLVGSVPLSELVLAPRSERLETIATSPTPSVQAMSSREDVLEALDRQRGVSLPVVDVHHHLLGVLRQEELVGAAQRDAVAKAMTMVGADRNERALSPVSFAVRKRLPWLQVNLLTAFLAAAVVGIFESTIATYSALAVLLPVVAGQSGNTGAQALAVTMRGLTLREIRTRQWFRVALKEVGAGAANGIAVALTTSIAVYVWSGSNGLAGVIGISMVCSMTAAGFAGAVIPMLLMAARQDPAQSSSIILTTVTDVVGFFSFLSIATLLASTL